MTDTHWNAVFSDRPDMSHSWHEDMPQTSLELIARVARPGCSVIDIGGGASRLIDGLLARDMRDLAVLDLSDAALALARERLGRQAALVEWIVADVTRWHPRRHWNVWHDRAAFHFLTDAEDRRAYVAALRHTLAPDGYAVIATFGPNGPERCSNLPICRYSPQKLAAELGDGFTLETSRMQDHVTPGGHIQSFQYSVFRRS